jgi:multiple sugar transport system ATP-binding protein
MARVVLQHLERTFANGVQAVRDLNLDVASGELFVLVGPSGSGKTTTLRMIAGLDQPTRGEIFIDGRSVNRVSPADRDVAMVFQTVALYPHLTARENIAFGLKARRLPKLEAVRRVDDVAHNLSIHGLLARRPGDLSGGERSRVAIARAIVRRPKVLLLDEPLSGLDAPQRAQLRLEIARLPAATGVTIIYVTHDQAEAMTLGDRICVIDRGTLLQIDSPLAVYKRPVNTFVATFLGTPGMNLFQGMVQRGAFILAGPATNGSAAALGLAVGSEIADGPIALGVRPHDLAMTGRGQPLATVTVERVERLGHETAVYFELSGGQHSARVPADAVVQPGQPLSLWARSDSIHLFSTVDGRRLN